MQRDELMWAHEHERRLQEAGITDGGAEITSLARQQAAVVRKFIFEQTRKQRATGGYVLTGWRDTPIATSGVVDDLGELKFDPVEWQQFNADRVLVMDRERRRRWMHGGDRPVYRDLCCWWSDEPIEVHIALSNGGAAVWGAALRWRLVDAHGRLVEQGERRDVSVGAGEVAELAVINRSIDCDADLVALEFMAELVAEGESMAINRWPLWVVPRCKETRLLNSPALSGSVGQALLADVGAGGRRFVWLQSFDERFCVYQPFWRGGRYR